MGTSLQRLHLLLNLLASREGGVLFDLGLNAESQAVSQYPNESIRFWADGMFYRLV